MVVTELAEGSVAEHAGELTALFGFPIVGLILLIVGLRQRSRSRRQPAFLNPMVPPPDPYPYGYPPPNGPLNVGYPDPARLYCLQPMKKMTRVLRPQRPLGRINTH